MEGQAQEPSSQLADQTRWTDPAHGHCSLMGSQLGSAASSQRKQRKPLTRVKALQLKGITAMAARIPG